MQQTQDARAVVSQAPISDPPGREEIEVQMVTPAKRRRLLSEQQAAARADASAAGTVRQSAWDASMRTLAWHPESTATPPAAFMSTTIHASHNCLECGGFVGCVRCGSVVSTPQRSALDKPCRVSCPLGTRGPVKIMAAGRLPRGEAWPSGEVDPKPKRLRG